ncbi:MAG: HD domain-containing protein [Proteobacteria bacterium]|nr:HD domain-containing protein [Pseudomonadota bacterium]
MPQLYHRRIRDNRYGTIPLSVFENEVISHAWFQRLRYIKQLGFFHLVFPGAQHSRFEHSLGVMHLASKSFHRLRENLIRIETEQIGIREQLKQERVLFPKLCEDRLGYELIRGLFASEYSETVFRLAALLHDIGHCPYSHCTEKFLPLMTEMVSCNPEIPDHIKQAMIASHSTLATSHGSNGQSGSRASCHEAYSLLLTWQILLDLEQNNVAFPCFKEDILALLSPDLPLHPESPFHQLKGYHVLRNLLSGQWDIDRMDYLQRDSIQSGVEYGKFDEDRLLNSMYVVWHHKSQRYILGFLADAMPALEDFLRARQSMFSQLYFHKTSVASEAMILHLSRLLGDWRFPANAQVYAGLRDHDLEQLFTQKLQEVSGLSREQKKVAERIIQGLFCDRKLWKKVYELKAQDKRVFDRSELIKIQHHLNVCRIPNEMVRSVNHLTERPSPHHQDLSYCWVRKDAYGLVQIVSYDQLWDQRQEDLSCYIVRIYVDHEKYLISRKEIGQLLGTLSKK